MGEEKNIKTKIHLSLLPPLEQKKTIPTKQSTTPSVRIFFVCMLYFILPFIRIIRKEKINLHLVVSHLRHCVDTHKVTHKNIFPEKKGTKEEKKLQKFWCPSRI